jgi:SAM-dependent methyltransferase
MAEMPRFSRWLVNRRTGQRARRALARLGDHLQLPPSARVLELGSGGGGMLALLQEQFHPELLVGTDYDVRQVDAARNYLASKWGAIPDTVQLQAADALGLPFGQGSFDVVFGMMMLHHVEDHHGDFQHRPQAIREIRRVLSPGGLFVYSEFSRREAVRSELARAGFVARFLRSDWRKDIGIFEAAPQGIAV